MKKKRKVRRPETVPFSQLSDASQRFLLWKRTFVVVVVAFLAMIGLNLFSESPALTGYASYEAPSAGPFIGASSVVFVILMTFGWVGLLFYKKHSELWVDSEMKRASPKVKRSAPKSKPKKSARKVQKTRRSAPKRKPARKKAASKKRKRR